MSLLRFGSCVLLFFVLSSLPDYIRIGRRGATFPLVMDVLESTESIREDAATLVVCTTIGFFLISTILDFSGRSV